MRVLAIAPKCVSFPIGLSYVVAAIKRAGFPVDCVNLNLEPDFKIPYRKYDLVATGGLACHFKDIRNIAREAKTAGSKVVIGGGIITAEPEFMKKQLDADHFILGEGEESIVSLLESSRRGADIPPLISSDSIKDLDSLPFPDYDAFGYRDYLNKFNASDAFFSGIFDDPRTYFVVASRSCPSRCTFCYSPLGNKYRQRSIDSIIKEIEIAIPRYNINIVQIIDELFSYDDKRILEFCDRFNALRASYSWDIKWGCCLRVDRLKEEILDRLKESGCLWIQYGFESYSSTVLKSMKKYIKPDQIHRAIHLTLDRNISVQANFIFGDRAETMETASETLSFWREHADAGILLYYIWPFPNSELYRYCIEKGIIPDKIDYYENGLFAIRNMTGMSNDDFEKMQAKITMHVLKYTPTSVPNYVSKNVAIIRCPCCGETTTYRNYTIFNGCAFTNLYPVKPGKIFFYKQVYCRSCRRSFMAISRLAKIWFGFIVMTYSPAFVKIYKMFVILKRQRKTRIKESFQQNAENQ